MNAPDPGAFLVALEKLPALTGAVYRGVPPGATFVRPNQVVVTSGLTTVTRHLAVLGATPSVYAISTRSARDISLFSAQREEQEAVVLPGTALALSHCEVIGQRTVFFVFEMTIGEQICPDQVAAFVEQVRPVLAEPPLPEVAPRERFVGDIG